MDIGTGIVIGCAIFGVVEFTIRMFGRKPSNPNSKVLKARLDSMEETFGVVRRAETCDAFREGFAKQLTALKDTMDSGFQHINNQLQEIRQSLDHD